MEKMIQRNSCGFVGRLSSSSRMNREGCGCYSREPGQRKQQGQKSLRQCLRRSVGLGAVGREAEVPRTEAKGKRGSRGGGHRGADLEELRRTDIHSTQAGMPPLDGIDKGMGGRDLTDFCL